MSKLMTAEEVAGRLRFVPKTWVYRAARGRPVTGPTRSLSPFDEADVNEWIAAQKKRRGALPGFGRSTSVISGRLCSELDGRRRSRRTGRSASVQRRAQRDFVSLPCAGRSRTDGLVG